MATSQDIISISPTVYGTYLQTIKQYGLPYQMIPNTTLNELFDIQAGVAPAPGKIPNMKYLAIGNLGHTFVKASDGSFENDVIPHRADDAGLYGQIPFVMREVGNDLMATERAKYALRTMENHDGTDYFVYYLRRIDVTDITPQLQLVQNVDGVASSTPFVPTTDNLNPVAPDIANSGTIVGSDTMISVSAVTTLNLGPEEIANIIEAHQIRTGSTRTPVISEFALCSGVDKDVQGSAGSAATFTYSECIACQINVIVSAAYNIGYTTDGLELVLDVGGSEPLLSQESLASADFA